MHAYQITLTPESVQKARELGFNISKIAQNALDEAIKRRTQPNHQNNYESNLNSSGKNTNWWAGPDLNRGPSACQADVLTKLDDRPLEVFC